VAARRKNETRLAADAQKECAGTILYFILTFVVYPLAGVTAGCIGLRTVDGDAGPAVVRFVLLWQCVLVGCLAPFFYSVQRDGDRIRMAAKALARTVGVVVASSAVAAILSLIAGGGLQPVWIARSAAIVIGFGVILVGVSSLTRRLGGRPHAGQSAACAAAALMLSTVFIVNPAVAATRGKTKIAVIQVAVVGNPLVAAAGAGVDYDILLSRRSAVSLYNISLIGPDHLYRYPPWWLIGGGYCVAGLILIVLASFNSFKGNRSGGSTK
jgi:hypothetical protein